MRGISVDMMFIKETFKEYHCLTCNLMKQNMKGGLRQND